MFSPWNIYIKRIKEVDTKDKYISVEFDIRTERFLTTSQKRELLLLLDSLSGQLL